jgi:hypothetical protein
MKIMQKFIKANPLHLPSTTLKEKIIKGKCGTKKIDTKIYMIRSMTYIHMIKNLKTTLLPLFTWLNLQYKRLIFIGELE